MLQQRVALTDRFAHKFGIAHDAGLGVLQCSGIHTKCVEQELPVKAQGVVGILQGSLVLPQGSEHDIPVAPQLRASVRKREPTLADCGEHDLLVAPQHLEGMLGNAGFDPWGLSTPQNIKWMREAELKHGRMCQLAWLGYVAVDCGIKFPGEKYAALSSFTAHEGTATLELFYLLLFVGTAETIGFTQIYSMMDGSLDREPGDFGFDPLKLLTPATEEKYKAKHPTKINGLLRVVASCGNTTFPAPLSSVLRRSLTVRRLLL